MHIRVGTLLLPTAVFLTVVASSVDAQQLVVPARDAAVSRALGYLRESEGETLDDQVALCEILAPHSLDESFDTTDSHRGTQWAFLLALTLAGVD